MNKYNIFYGVTYENNFKTIEAEDKTEAENIARDMAISYLEDFGGMHGYPHPEDGCPECSGSGEDGYDDNDECEYCDGSGQLGYDEFSHQANSYINFGIVKND